VGAGRARKNIILITKGGELYLWGQKKKTKTEKETTTFWINQSQQNVDKKNVTERKLKNLNKKGKEVIPLFMEGKHRGWGGRGLEGVLGVPGVSIYVRGGGGKFFEAQ